MRQTPAVYILHQKEVKWEFAEKVRQYLGFKIIDVLSNFPLAFFKYHLKMCALETE